MGLVLLLLGAAGAGASACSPEVPGRGATDKRADVGNTEVPKDATTERSAAPADSEVAWDSSLPPSDAAAPADAGVPTDAALSPDTAVQAPDTGVVGAKVLLDEGFESGGIGNWTCSGNCPTVTTAPVFQGKYAGRFFLTPTTPVSYRTEAVVNGGMHFAFGKKYRIELRYRYEDWVKDNLGESAPLQVHTRPSAWTSACQLGSAYSTAPFFVHCANDTINFVTYGGKILWSGAVVTKKWLSLVIEFRVSWGADGLIEAWLDGVKLGKQTGPNSPKLDKCGQPMQTPYLKVGVYKWDWKTKIDKATKRELIIDNIKVSSLP